MRNIFKNRSYEISAILGVDDPGDGSAIVKEAGNLKNENRKLNNVIDGLKEESAYGVFCRLSASGAYYAKNKDVCDSVFADVIGRDKLALISVDILDDERNFSAIHAMVTDRFRKMGLSYVFVNGISGKSVYVAGFNKSVPVNNIIKLFGFTREQMETAGYRVLVAFSREFTDISGIYEASKDIKVCRNYRRLNDTVSVISADDVSISEKLFVPVNFSEELKIRILEKNETKIREYIREVFDINIKKGVPLIKFEHLLRIMQNAVTGTLSMIKSGNPAELFELEQIFVRSIEQFESTLDPEILINSYMNMIRFSLAKVPERKSLLIRSDVVRFINGHFAEDLFLEKLAEEFSTTPKYFSNWFKKEFSVGFVEYLASVRIARAKKLLCDTDITISGVGEKVGYSNSVTFSVAFKKNAGISPGKYRELNR